MALLKRDHGIELKSASSSLEEVVARSFVERLARQRNVALPSGDMFSDAPAPAKGGKKSVTTKKVEPPKPAAPTLGPPRLVKVIKPLAPPPPVEETYRGGGATGGPCSGCLRRTRGASSACRRAGGDCRGYDSRTATSRGERRGSERRRFAPDAHGAPRHRTGTVRAADAALAHRGAWSTTPAAASPRTRETTTDRPAAHGEACGAGASRRRTAHRTGRLRPDRHCLAPRVPRTRDRLDRPLRACSVDLDRCPRSRCVRHSPRRVQACLRRGHLSASGRRLVSIVPGNDRCRRGASARRRPRCRQPRQPRRLSRVPSRSRRE